VPSEKGREKTVEEKEETKKTGRYTKGKWLKGEIKTKKRKKNGQKADYS
jgi:hypothetical protein